MAPSPYIRMSKSLAFTYPFGIKRKQDESILWNCARCSPRLLRDVARFVASSILLLVAIRLPKRIKGSAKNPGSESSRQICVAVSSRATTMNSPRFLLGSSPPNRKQPCCNSEVSHQRGQPVDSLGAFATQDSETMWGFFSSATPAKSASFNNQMRMIVASLAKKQMQSELDRQAT